MLDRRKKEERRMKKNEKLYFHGNGGFEQVDNKGRIKDEEKIAITSANKGLPCETAYFVERFA